MIPLSLFNEGIIDRDLYRFDGNVITELWLGCGGLDGLLSTFSSRTFLLCDRAAGAFVTTAWHVMSTSLQARL